MVRQVDQAADDLESTSLIHLLTEIVLTRFALAICAD
jgi:hypothetical protein